LSLFKELKRRNVFKVAIAYAVTTWILLQLTDVLMPILALPDWAPKLILLMLVVGFVPALIIAWAFELTPEGIKLEKDVKRSESITPKTGRKLNYIIIVSLGLSLGFFVWESRFKQKTEEAELARQAALTEEPVVEEAKPEEPPLPPLKVEKNSIAVLPFANRSADDNDIYFTDGIHDDLLTQLSKIDAFSVISRTSVMEYRNTAKNLKQIARELNVANIMEGSVQRSGDRVRINVQLIDAATDEHLWAEIYDRELTTNNLFDIQSEIAKAIAAALKATLTDSELASVSDVPTDNVAAYDLYLQARRISQNWTQSNIDTAIDLYKEALALDPDFKYAWTGLADAHINNYWSSGNTEDRDMAHDAIEHARSIDEDFAELYTAEGYYWYWGFLDYERALYKLDKAIEMMPGNEQAWMGRGFASRRSGLWEQALESIQKAVKLNPRVHLNWVELAWTLQYLHRYEEADRAIAKAREIDPDNFYGKTAEAFLDLQARGDVQTAVKLTIGAQRGDVYDFLETYMVVSFLARRYEEALDAARGFPGELEIQRNVITLKEDWAAQTLHFMGRQEEAGKAAAAALFRLKGLQSELGEDYRLDLAQARIRALQGASGDEVRDLVKRSLASAPADIVAEFERRAECARIYAIANMAPDAIEMLEPLFQPPSEISVYKVDLDPAFDTIREDPSFVAMMDKHR